MRRRAFTVDDMVEMRYRAQLRLVARQVGQIVASFPTPDVQAVKELERSLEAYATAIRSWAAKAALQMIKDSARANSRDWERTLRINKHGAPSDKDSTRREADRTRMVATLARDRGRIGRYAIGTRRASAPIPAR